MTNKTVAAPEPTAEVLFVLKCISAMKAINIEDGHPERKGTHVVYDGLNDLFKQKFGVASMEITNKMAADGMIYIKPERGGVRLYLAEDKPIDTSKRGKLAAALAAG